MPRSLATLCLALWLSASTQFIVPNQGPLYQLDSDRRTAWSPGVTYTGGIPARSTSCATVNASTYGDGASDASAGIQAAIDGCPAGQVVNLSAGTFTLNDYILINKGITVRGAGPTQTLLQKTDGAAAYPPDTPPTSGNGAKPLVILGPSRFPGPDNATSVNLTADGTKGATSVTVSSGTGFVAGQIVLLDEDAYTNGAFIALPNRSGSPTSIQIWATDRVVWKVQTPTQSEDDGNPPTSTEFQCWFMRCKRAINEMKEVASVNGNTITFTTPIHITYRTTATAQLTRFTQSGSQSGADSRHVKNAAIEDVKLTGGGDGELWFLCANASWAKNVDVQQWLGEGVGMSMSYRVELRDSYVHDAATASPGGGGYAVSIQSGTSDCLVENNIIRKADKAMVARATGAGCVVAYNYTDDSFIDYDNAQDRVTVNSVGTGNPATVTVASDHHYTTGTTQVVYLAGTTTTPAITGQQTATFTDSTHFTIPVNVTSGQAGAGGTVNVSDTWQEVGVNGSHMVGPHHMLFEGNYGQNADSDETHGSSIYHTFLRNQFAGTRTSFTGMANARCVGLAYGSYWMSFLGNVLGKSGQMAGWLYDNLGNGTDATTSSGDPFGTINSIWKLGYEPIHWDQQRDSQVRTTVIRDGNWDYLTTSVHWDHGVQTLPNSLYLSGKPAFFGSCTWPWVDAAGGTKLYTLPAKARYDAGTPFTSTC
jgi:hypothetical protein